MSHIRIVHQRAAGDRKKVEPPSVYPRDRLRPARPGLSVNQDELKHLPVPSEETLRNVFDLTQAEARIAQNLARGASLEEIATRLQIRMSTARTQLASIFSKTSTCRQAKLVAVLSRLAHLSERKVDLNKD